MAVWFISRHKGALEWIKQKGIHIDHWCEHLNENDIVSGDIYIGTLPIHIAQQICEKNGIFYFLELDLPRELRGKELTVEEMNRANGRLTQYDIKMKNIIDFE